MVLAADTGWFVGIGLGVVVVLVVAVLVIMLITAAKRIHSEAKQAIDTLEQVRGTTQSLHDVDQVNNHAVGILKGARAARETLK